MQLRLFVLSGTPKSEAALANLRRLLEQEIPGGYALEVVDVREQPQLAEDDRILATPTLIRQAPGPIHRIVGDMSDTAKVMLGLGLGPRRGLQQRGVHE